MLKLHAICDCQARLLDMFPMAGQISQHGILGDLSNRWNNRWHFRQ